MQARGDQISADAQGRAFALMSLVLLSPGPGRHAVLFASTKDVLQMRPHHLGGFVRVR